MHMLYRRLLTATLSFSLLLGSWRGHVALFSEGEDAPLDLYPVRLELLPPEDQKNLLEGIPVRNTEELMRILEDFLS